MEGEGLVVSEAVKFPVTRQTAKTAYVETQTHGFEVDLVGARADRLVLATVKSFFGSRGVVAEHVTGETTSQSKRLYALLNDSAVRDAVVAGACERYGYKLEQVELRLCVGKFAGGTAGDHERRIRTWCAARTLGSGPIRVFGLDEIVPKARALAARKQYRDNPALVAIKVLEAAHQLIPLEE